jgi:hypothetical protein
MASLVQNIRRLVAVPFLILLLSFFSIGEVAYGYSIELGTANTISGASISVPVYIDSGTAALGGYDLTFTYDSSLLQYQSGAGFGPYFSSGQSTLLVNSGQAGTLKVLGQQFLSLTAPVGKTQVAQLNFLVSGANGTKSTLKITSAQSYDTDGVNLLPLILVDGIINIGEVCTYSLNPVSGTTLPTFAVGGASQVVSITASAATCAWSLANNGSSFVSFVPASGAGTQNVTITLAANAGASRTAKVDVLNGSGASVGFYNINQQGVACSLTMSPVSPLAVGAGASTQTISVTANLASCSWTPTSNSAFLTIATGAGAHSGSGSFSVAVAANTGLARTGSLTIASGVTYTINQAAGACSYSLTPASGTVFGSIPAAGASYSATVTASRTDCPWSVSNNGSTYLTATPASGMGTATINFSVAANTGAGRVARASLVGASSVALGYYDFSQFGVACTYSMSPASPLVVSATGVTGQVVNVTTNLSSCVWAPTTASNFISVTSGTFTGNGSFSLSVSANSGGARTGSIGLASGVSYSVNQAAAACSYSFSPVSGTVFNSIPSGGGNYSATITTNRTDCPWTATNNGNTFISVTPISGTGSGTINFTVATNLSVARSGRVNIAGELGAAAGFYDFNQLALACTYSMSPASPLQVGTAGVTGQLVNVTTNSATCAWSPTTSSAFIAVSGGSFTGSGSFSLSVSANSGLARSGTINLASGVSYTVSQAAAPCSFTLNPVSGTTFSSIAPAGGSQVIGITASRADCGWSMSNNGSSFISFSPASGSGSANVTVTVAANAGGARSARVDVLSGGLSIGNFSFQQLGVACTYSLSPTTITIGYRGTRKSRVYVTAPAGCAWTPVNNQAFTSIVSVSGGSGNGFFDVKVLKNTTTSSRTGTVTVESAILTIVQSAR